jgi:hypothetical protein
MLDSGLPLNRKERYYTGTVLPMIVASDGFAHLHRFLSLCDLDVGEFGGHGRDGEQRVQLFTEYSFVESRYTEADVRRFPDAPADNDTPDVVLLGEDWLLAVEAKMFHTPSITALNAQVARQKVIVDYLAKTLRLSPERVRHVPLLPAPLASDGARGAGGDLGERAGGVPRRGTALLGRRAGRRPGQAQRSSGEGSVVRREPRRAARRRGHPLRPAERLPALHLHGTAGRAARWALAQDLEDGSWRTRKYEVRYEPLVARNWFAITDFLARLPQ